MTINSNQIRESVYGFFKKKYKENADFVNSGDAWNSCMSAINDLFIINTIIFCNDVLHMPPADIFEKAMDIKNLTDKEKQDVGMLWDYIFVYVFGYEKSTESNGYYNNSKDEKVTVN